MTELVADPHHHHAGRYAAIAATLALGTVAVEPERAHDGGVHIWLDPQAQGAARPRRELQRRHPEAGKRRRRGGMIVRDGGASSRHRAA